MQPQQILIIQTAFLGDVVLATVIIEKLKQYYPDAKIDFLLRKGNESLLAHHPKLNQVLIWDKKQRKWQNLWQLLQYIRKQKYDIVINAQRFLTTGILTALSGAKQTIGFNKNPLAWTFSKRIPHTQTYKHEVERNLQLVSHLTNNQVIRPSLYPTANDYEAIKTYQNKPYITIAPTSVWFTKQFPAQKWIDFIKKTVAQNIIHADTFFFLLGSPTDIPLCQTIAEQCQNFAQIENLAGKITLLQSTALMQKALMNYANDSAPVHLASAINAPICLVYCSTVPEFGFYPLSDIHFVVQATQALPCRPCGLHGYATCPQKHFACANSIQIEQLTKILV